MSTGDAFFALLKERLPNHFVETWEGNGGEEAFRAIARVFETVSDRDLAELRAARILVATTAEKATGTITITWDAIGVDPYELAAGNVIARTSWGVEYVLTEPIVRTAAQAAGSASYDVEARWAGWGGNVDADFVLTWAFDSTGAGLVWTDDDGEQEFLGRVAAGTITISASSAMTGGRMGTLDLLAMGEGRPRAEGETDGDLRKRIRAHIRAITPDGIRDAVRTAIGSSSVVIAEPWEWGFAWGESGWGEEAWMPSLRFAIVLVPEGSDLVALQEFADRLRPYGYRVLVLEAEASVFA